MPLTGCGILIETMTTGPAVDGTVKAIQVSAGDPIGARQALFGLS
ncbi:MAG TPA: hypothetical protein VGS58_08440 [Candidatus Sulfopaludibacter sp.]|nr:hypothetical protein [Candidatus Sulfopaludibacter sp.]